MWQKADAKNTLGKPVLSGPSRSLVGSVEEFYCKLDNIQTNEIILYELFNEVNLYRAMGEYSSHSKEEATFPSLITPDYDGTLICKASVQNNSEISPTFSTWMNFSVVVPVEGAHIISSPPSEELWERDSVTLQCNVTKGTYVSYEWFLNDRLLLNDSKKLHISSLSSKDSGKYVCVATNYLNETDYYNSRSDGRNVHVKESVGGTVTMTLQKSTGKDFEVSGVLLNCKVERGMHPHYNWFINNARLEGQGSFYRTFHPDNSVLTVSLYPNSGSAGFYHCEAFNSFDNTTRPRF
ncbi:Fc receptor-like protein 5 isoform X2 [Hemibagrus wyckioides]|nr:Fc receptor-like protein 5 isoform X2 [Hemibagrus wyckioides]XP_058256187.1 Fc receptor-like protein 5 isoform X2 [Hemibagrus wyckioides]